MSQQETKDRAKYFYRASTDQFMKIPGGAVAYWASDATLQAFTQNPPLSAVIETREGLTSGSNDLFLRLWFEVSLDKIGFEIKDSAEAQKSEKRFFPYVKGGDFRRWAGNYEYVVNWFNDGEELKKFKDPDTGRVRSHNYNGEYGFKPGFTWSGISSGTFAARTVPEGFMFDAKGPMGFMLNFDEKENVEALLNSGVTNHFLKMLAPTLDFKLGHILNLPVIKNAAEKIKRNRNSAVKLSLSDWNSYETSWDFETSPLVNPTFKDPSLKKSYEQCRDHWQVQTFDMQNLEQENNDLFIKAYGLHEELTPEVPLEDITLTRNPAYRYGSKRSVEEIEILLQCDTTRELVSYAIGCMMGRYSPEVPGLILVNQGETLHDYLRQIPSPRFMPDDDAILPLTDQEWFIDDATNRFREFVRVVWGDEHLQENLDFVAESLCLHAIKPKRGESALDTIRRYLSNHFFKDHLRTYKKRPIYWLFSSGKHKAFECLVYLHRYNEGTLARMRTEYVIPLSAKLNAYAEKLEQDKEASTSAAETKRLEKEIATLHKQQVELAEFDEKLRHYADHRISLDLDDGVKVNYGKFGDLLGEVKAVTGEKPQ